ncbi:hypothetical protein VCHC37A1_2442A, partial [Vibrio cholerae HC-37A1]
MSNQVIN